MGTHEFVFATGEAFQSKASAVEAGSEGKGSGLDPENGSVTYSTARKISVVEGAIGSFDQRGVWTPWAGVWKLMEKSEAGAVFVNGVDSACIIDSTKVGGSVEQATGAFNGRVDGSVTGSIVGNELVKDLVV